VSGGSDPLLRHIRHAEEWLGRARLDWRRGNAPAAMLRLMLAEAEIRHAREADAETRAPRPAAPEGRRAGRSGRVGWLRPAAAVAATAVLAAGLGYASMRLGSAQHDALAARGGSAAGVAGRSGQAAGEISRTIVRLDSGQFLMPETAGGGPGDPGARPLQFAVPVDLRTPSPTF
jgi:hypothetical protein